MSQARDWELGYRARVAMNSREPNLRSPDQSEFGAVSRRGDENPPRPDGTRYRPKAASLMLPKSDPYWAVGYGGEAVLIYPD